MNPYYDHAGITIFHGDCREVLPGLQDGGIDFILTDPPYGHNNNDHGDLSHRREFALGLVKQGVSSGGKERPIANDGPEADPLARFIFDQAARLLVPGGCCACFGGGGGPDPQFARWALWMGAVLEFKQAVIWDKGGLGMGWHYRRNYETVLVGEKPGAACKWYGGHSQANVIRFPGIKPSEDDHPTPKPVELLGLFVRLHSEVGDLVLDPCMGAGATLRAAKDLGRRAIGIEIEEKYCEMAARRLSQEVIICGD